MFTLECCVCAFFFLFLFSSFFSFPIDNASHALPFATCTATLYMEKIHTLMGRWMWSKPKKEKERLSRPQTLSERVSERVQWVSECVCVRDDEHTSVEKKSITHNVKWEKRKMRTTSVWSACFCIKLNYWSLTHSHSFSFHFLGLVAVMYATLLRVNYIKEKENHLCRLYFAHL